MFKAHIPPSKLGAGHVKRHNACGTLPREQACGHRMCLRFGCAHKLVISLGFKLNQLNSGIRKQRTTSPRKLHTSTHLFASGVVELCWWSGPSTANCTFFLAWGLAVGTNALWTTFTSLFGAKQASYKTMTALVTSEADLGEPLFSGFQGTP